MNKQTHEINFDGLVGPTHNYSGLSFGNLASTLNFAKPSNPRAAALQGLKKMKLLNERGLRQGVFPPQERPALHLLSKLGFSGETADILKKAQKEVPAIFNACFSASSMWAANAATVTPSIDAADGCVHFTPANLISNLHRSLEPRGTAAMLKKIFPPGVLFQHHDPLPSVSHFGDEGAANHTRFSATHGTVGLHLFVYGKHVFGDEPSPKKFPARQTREASRSIARLHGLSERQTVFALQNPDVVDAGVFHNDVISVGNERLFLYHERTFAHPDEVKDELERKSDVFFGAQALHFVPVRESDLSVADAVKSYLFNTQIVSLSTGGMLIIAPKECEEVAAAHAVLEGLKKDSATGIKEVLYLDLRESMSNGGGPACLRLRVPLTDEEWRQTLPGVRFSEALYSKLTAWVEKRYRDRLTPDDLADPQFLTEVHETLDELTTLLGLGSDFYGFQREG